MLEKLNSGLLESADIEMYVSRIDKIHPQISGNKWFKLRYNLEEAKQQGKNTILTFGGAYSNHIYATAQAGKEYGFETIGIIRGEETLPLNETLEFAQNRCGMKLHYMDRTTYRNKNNLDTIQNLKMQFGDFYLVPEGGSNVLAVKGCTEILNEVDIDFDYVCTAVGTGGTLAGITASLQTGQKALGFAALKGASFLYDDVDNLLKEYYQTEDVFWKAKYELLLDYHFGGYAKQPEDLVKFVQDFYQQFNIPVEPIYTGKMFFGIFDLIQKGFFPKKSVILALHTGGLR